MTGGGQDQADTKIGQGDTYLHQSLSGRNHPYESKQECRIRNLDSDNSSERELSEDDEEEEEDDDDDLLSDALLAVTSAEEYAAKIIKLQQSCLTPLKEDLADWLNKIMNMSSITTDNFMDKLDNGVIICKLAKIISIWCEEQLATDLLSSSATAHQPISQGSRTASQLKLTDVTSAHNSHLPFSTSKLSTSTLNVHSAAVNYDKIADTDNYTPFHHHHHNHLQQYPQQYPASRTNTSTSVIANSHLRQTHPLRSAIFGGNPLRSSSLSPNCLVTSSTTSLNGYNPSGNQFLNNLIQMNQTKIWEDAKCRTFYARDNVSNFIRWSKEFGVNQSVLFESDDLVLHANPRQVVLCLLDVARIACVRHGFTEAPGLVKFEQEIDRELAAEKAAAINRHPLNTTDDCLSRPLSGDKELQNNEHSANRKRSSLAKITRGCSMANATDDLIMRYCMHKEEEAARKKAAELEAVAESAKQENDQVTGITITATSSPALVEITDSSTEIETVDTIENQENGHDVKEDTLAEADSLNIADGNSPNSTIIKSPSSDLIAHKANLTYDSRVDSLDSGEGRTESASTSHSRTRLNGLNSKRHISSIPVPIMKRSNSNSSLTSNPTSSISASELSSSRSSLLSGQENNSGKRHIVSDLDGKVMRIAKSYYGKGATKGVKRLSEGKYKIADRIVFVRLLKGHQVMVRIGGGWDTLENFLFRHKSDPSQVIDVDNLLPLETKMTFEKNLQSTPTNSKSFSKLPYYRRSSSASSTNLSISNFSISNHSPMSSRAASSINTAITSSTPIQQPNSHESPRRQSTVSKQVPYFLIHRGQNTKSTPHQAFSYNSHNTTPVQHHKEAMISQPKTASSNRYTTTNRPLGYSRTPTASSTNLYPATLTTRIDSANVRSIANNKLNSGGNNIPSSRKTPRQAAVLRKMGQSNESLPVASYLKSPQINRQQQQNGSQLINGQLSTKRKMETQQRSTNGLSR